MGRMSFLPPNQQRQSTGWSCTMEIKPVIVVAVWGCKLFAIPVDSRSHVDRQWAPDTLYICIVYTVCGKNWSFGPNAPHLGVFEKFRLADDIHDVFLLFKSQLSGPRQ